MPPTAVTTALGVAVGCTPGQAVAALPGAVVELFPAAAAMRFQAVLADVNWEGKVRIVAAHAARPERGSLFATVAAFSSSPLRLMPSTIDMSSLEGPCGVCRKTSLDSKGPWGPDPCLLFTNPSRQRQYSGSMESSESTPQPDP